MVSLSTFLSWSMDTLTFSFNSVSALAFDLLSIDPLKLVKSVLLVKFYFLYENYTVFPDFLKDLSEDLRFEKARFYKISGRNLDTEAFKYV